MGHKKEMVVVILVPGKKNFDLTSTKNSLGKLLKKNIKMQINE